jgi:hypothetical protein
MEPSVEVVRSGRAVDESQPPYFFSGSNEISIFGASSVV